MNEHKQLKEICDLIGYDWGESKCIWCEGDNYFERFGEGVLRKVDVREIIFTTEFRIAFIICYSDYMGYMYQSDAEDIFAVVMEWLDNPVEYLHNLLELCLDD